MPLIQCQKCGAITSDEYSYCTSCQAPIVTKPEEPEHLEREIQTLQPIIDSKASSSRTKQSSLDTARGLTTQLDNETSIDKSIRDVKEKRCPNCGAPMPSHLKFCSNCGRALTIDLAEVLNSTLRILRKRPVIIIPMLVEQLVSAWIIYWTYFPLLGELNPAAASLSLQVLWPYFVRLFVTSIVLGITVVPLVYGMYPVMVKRVVQGEGVDLVGAFVSSVRKFPSLCVSFVLVGVAVIVGMLALIVPGFIAGIWYYYTTPAIMLENRGARDGMSASKAFSRDKKWDGFTIFLISFIPSFAGGFLLRTVPLTAWNTAPYLTISLFFGVIAGVLSAAMTSYAYLAYAMPNGRLPNQIKRGFSSS